MVYLLLHPTANNNNNNILCAFEASLIKTVLALVLAGLGVLDLVDLCSAN